ncbi:hypothetical protein [Mycolicibacterium litorale]|nr:hypothetical protein [Mycolicibacterium litorale]
MNGSGIGVDLAHLDAISPAAPATAICSACGYPTMQPGLCAYCRPVPML